MGNHSIEFDVKGFVMYNEIGFVMILKVLSSKKPIKFKNAAAP